MLNIFFFFFLKDFIYLFLERGEGKKKERERNISVWLCLVCPLMGTWPATQTCVLTGNRASYPLVCRPVLNPLSHTSQGNLQIFNLWLSFHALNTVSQQKVLILLKSHWSFLFSFMHPCFGCYYIKTVIPKITKTFSYVFF